MERHAAVHRAGFLPQLSRVGAPSGPCHGVPSASHCRRPPLLSPSTTGAPLARPPRPFPPPPTQTAAATASAKASSLVQGGSAPAETLACALALPTAVDTRCRATHLCLSLGPCHPQAALVLEGASTSPAARRRCRTPSPQPSRRPWPLRWPPAPELRAEFGAGAGGAADEKRCTTPRRHMLLPVPGTCLLRFLIVSTCALPWLTCSLPHEAVPLSAAATTCQCIENETRQVHCLA